MILHLKYLVFLVEQEFDKPVSKPRRRKDAMHPSISGILKFFAYSHLPEHLQAISKPFGELAQQCADRSPDSPETTVALRKLLEAKDAAVRAALP